MAISWRDSVDGGVKGQPGLAVEVIPTETESGKKDVMIMKEQH